MRRYHDTCLFQIDDTYERAKKMNIPLRKHIFPTISQNNSDYNTIPMKVNVYEIAMHMKVAYNTIFSAGIEYLAPHLGDDVNLSQSAYAVDEYLFESWAKRYMQHYNTVRDRKFTYDIVMERIRMHAYVRLKSMFAKYFYQTDEHTAHARMRDLALFIEGVDTAF
jgi:hypothetical protein